MQTNTYPARDAVCSFRAAALAALVIASSVAPAPAQMPGAAGGEKPHGPPDAVIQLKASAHSKMGHTAAASRAWLPLPV